MQGTYGGDPPRPLLRVAPPETLIDLKLVLRLDYYARGGAERPGDLFVGRYVEALARQLDIDGHRVDGWVQSKSFSLDHVRLLSSLQSYFAEKHGRGIRAEVNALVERLAEADDAPEWRENKIQVRRLWEWGFGTVGDAEGRSLRNYRRSCPYRPSSLKDSEDGLVCGVLVDPRPSLAEMLALLGVVPHSHGEYVNSFSPMPEFQERREPVWAEVRLGEAMRDEAGWSPLTVEVALSLFAQNRGILKEGERTLLCLGTKFVGRETYEPFFAHLVHWHGAVQVELSDYPDADQDFTMRGQYRLC